MIKAGIIGSTGYASQELVRLLMQHPDVEIVWYEAQRVILISSMQMFSRICFRL